MIKRFFRKCAAFFVTAWAKLVYSRGVLAAEKRHQREHCMIFLAQKPFHPNEMTTYNRRQFKMHKEAFGYHARLLTMVTLKNGCYYHTTDQFGKNGLSQRDIDIRRRAFIKERLRAAGLV